MTNNNIIRIDQQQSAIPVVIGELEYQFSMSDENISNFRGDIMDIANQMTSMDVSGHSERQILNETKRLLKAGFDGLLGDGTFDELYEVTPSSIVLSGYFAQIVLQLSGAIERFSDAQMEHTQKYRRKGNKDYYNKGSESAKRHRNRNRTGGNSRGGNQPNNNR